MLRDDIRDEIAKTIDNLHLTADKKDIEVTRTADAKFGDFTTNVALKVAKSQRDKEPDVKQSPMEIAKILADNLKNQPYVEKLEVAEPGFLNFWIKDEVWQEEVNKVYSDKWKVRSGQSGKKIVVEYAHPNTHKLFHIGHLRNITTGETICRLLEAVGHEVHRVNYQGDVGLHIAKAIWGIKNLGEKTPKTLDAKVDLLARAYREGNRAYEDESAKEEIEGINAKIYDKDPEITKIWEETRAWSLEYFERIYRRVGTKFERYFFESEVFESGRKEVEKGLEAGIFEQSEGAIVFPGEKFGLHTRVFINSKGFPTYEGKDVGLAKLQFTEFSPDLVIHTVAPEQTDYFKVIFEAIGQVFPETKGKELHLAYGWVRLKEGKMSSRKGEVITGEWLLDEAAKKAKEIIEKSEVKKEVDVDEVSQQVAVGAVKYAFLKLGMGQDLVFDINEAVNLNGNSGPYIQYTYARCKSVLNKKQETGNNKLVIASPAESGVNSAKQSTKKIATPANGEARNDDWVGEESALLRTLGHFEEVIWDAAATYSPNVVSNFLFEIAQKYNTLYNNLPILKGTEEEKARRLFLTEATGEVLKKGLYLLGIEAPEKM